MKTLPGLLLLICSVSVAHASVDRTVLTGAVAPTFAGGQPGKTGTITRQELTAVELAAEQPVHFALTMRHFDELRARIGRGEVLSMAELSARYLPTRESWDKVARWAAAQGFRIADEDPSHLTVFANSSVANVQTRLFMKFARVVGTDGREHTSAISPPAIPAALSDAVISILELQPHLRPIGHQTIDPKQIEGGFISPQTIADLYNCSGLGLDGSGETIVILGGSKVNPDDLTAFWAKCGLPTTVAQFTEIDPFPGQLNSSVYASEETMDIEWASAMAPAAKIVYFSSISPDALAAWLFRRQATDNSIHQVNISFSLSEATGYNNRGIAASSQYFAAMTATGLSFFVASGDHGSTASVTDNGILDTFYFDPNGTTAPDYPASDPFVTAVGGTTVAFARDSNGSPTGPVTEGGWCLPNGVPISSDFGCPASTGGISWFFSRPPWQAGSGMTAGSMRCVPDVAAMAAGNCPPYYFFSGVAFGAGGTSLAAPIWTGCCALINQARAKAGLKPVGLLGPKIYPLLGTASFHPMTTGSNSGGDGFSASATIGAYAVGPGYNFVSGLGSPDLGNLIGALTAPQAGSAPAITTQPVTQNVTQGETATYTVAASGSPAPSYQWTFNSVALSDGPQFDGSIVSGSTTAALSIANAQGVNNFGQRVAVVATNLLGVAASNDVLLLVTLPRTAAQILASPTPQMITAGTTASFSVVAFGTAPLSFQWKKNGANIDGAVDSSYTIASAQPDSEGIYGVVVSNGYGSIYSGSASLTITSAPVAPSFTEQPADLTFSVGSYGIFMPTVSGTTPLSFQWYRNEEPMPVWGYSSDLVVNSSLAHNGDSFRLVASNSAGSVSSNTATITITKLSQAITFSAIGDKLLGGDPFTLDAAANSGLPVAFCIASGPATISGNTVTLTGRGTVTIRASQSGNDTYDAAPDVDQSFTVRLTSAKPWSVTATGAFQSGGKAGLLWFNTATDETAIWLMDGLTNAGAASYAPGADWSVAGTGDFDGDGRTDLLWRNAATGGAVVWFMHGTDLAGSKWIYDSGTAWVPYKLADFNGDGKTDILWHNNLTGDYAFWLMNGTGELLGASGFAVAPGWEIVQVADFNGDGKADIMWRNSSTGGIVLWLLNGTAIVSSPWIYDSGLTWSPAHIADLNGDGKADILWENVDGSKAIWLMNPGSELVGASGFSVAAGWEVALTADFNGDGKADILWRNSSTGGAVLWLMNGTATTSTPWIYNSGPSWTPIFAADFNGDGKADILWQNTDGSLAVWLMDGATCMAGAGIY